MTGTLPHIESEYSLSQQQIDSYQTNGHIVLQEVAAPDQVEPYHQVIRPTAMEYNTQQKSLEERDTYGKAFLQITNLREKSEQVKKFVFAKRFAGIAARLMGVDSVRLYHDQALFKEPGGGHTPWHQDGYYWPIDASKTITMWMPLVDVSKEMGTLRFASGSHRGGYLDDLPISDESHEVFEQYIRENGYTIAAAGNFKAGDASFHSGWTLHAAPGNNSGTLREAFTIIYYADGLAIQEPKILISSWTWRHGFRGNDRVRKLPVG